MTVKEIIKFALGRWRCLKTGINYYGRIYIGSCVHIVNGKNLSVGSEVQIRPNVDLFAGREIVIGDRCDIGVRNRIVGNVIIEPSVLIGPDNYICSCDHVFENPRIPIMDQGVKSVKKNNHEELKIGTGSWIGTHCAIIGDVHIGKNCVIGANSVVTSDIPDYSVAVGIPARVIKKYSFEDEQWKQI